MRFGEEYFQRWNYADRPLGRFSMYWFARRYYAALVRKSAMRRGGRLLELGCGLGHLLQLLDQDFRCFGVDIADFCIRRTLSTAPGATGLVADAGSPGIFRPQTFQAIVALHVLEHVENPANAIAEVHRLLEPGGVFLFATPNPVYALRRFKNPRTDAIGKDETHINVQEPDRWLTWCRAAGFQVEAHFGDGLWDTPYFKWIPARLQFAILGVPALLQVLTRGMWMPVSLGVNQVLVARRPITEA